MLRLLNLEEIESQVFRVPDIIRKFEQRDPDFVQATQDWLAEAEQTLNKNRMVEGAQIAVLRGSLIAWNRGFTDGAEPTPRTASRKLKEPRAAGLLKRATEIVSEAIRMRRAQMNEAESMMMQIVAVAEQLGLVPPSGGQDHTAYLESIRGALSARAELVSPVVHVTGLVGRVDFLVLLDRTISAYSA